MRSPITKEVRMRVDQTNSAIGVVRGTLGFDIETAEYDTVIGVGIDADGLVQKGASRTGIIGVIIPTKIARNIGDRCDVFKIAQVLADPGDVTDLGLLAGTPMYVDDITGVLTATDTGATRIGYTVEEDRLIVHMGGEGLVVS